MVGIEVNGRGFLDWLGATLLKRPSDFDSGWGAPLVTAAAAATAEAAAKTAASETTAKTASSS